MSETDGSSEAAHSAQPEDTLIAVDTEDLEDAPKTGGFFSRMMGALSTSDALDEEETTAAQADRLSARGMMNLRRMRVDDVAVPKADHRGTDYHQSGRTGKRFQGKRPDTPAGL